MREFHLHFHGDAGVYLKRLPELVALATQLETTMRQETQNLIAEIAAYKTVSEGAGALIDTLQDRLAECETDLTLLPQLSAELKAAREALIAAIAVNTPAAVPDASEPVNQPAIDAALDPAAVSDSAPTPAPADPPSTDGGGV